MSTLSTSPQDNRLFSAEIAAKLGDLNAAVIIQQLHYWLNKEGVGTIIGKTKYIYNTFNDWIKQFPWLSVWQFRKAMKLLRDLGIVKVIRYKSKQWNQTNYYTLDSDRLYQLLNPKTSKARPASGEETSPSFLAKSIENSELWDNTDRDERNQQIEVRDTNVSYIESKKTISKRTAETEDDHSRQSPSGEEKVAAVSLKTNLKQENNTTEEIHHQQKLNALFGQSKRKSEDNQTVTAKQESSASRSTKEIKTTRIANSNWRSLVEELDSLGVQINKTLVSLVKIYSEEEVKRAIALLKCRKQETHIPNMAGYFTAALKGGWVKNSVTSDEPTNSKTVDKADVFRLWYELAKELGYCGGQEVREGEQWVLLSGNWEKWKDACDRGYSLDYLKKVMKRSKSQ